MTPETKKALEAQPPDTKSSYYLADDSFEKVVAFYKSLGKQYEMPFKKRSSKLPGGQELKEAHFIFDGATDLLSSRSWIKVQRPYIGSVEMKDVVPEYHDVRDVTAIVMVQKK
jgi:hypothetical protein